MNRKIHLLFFFVDSCVSIVYIGSTVFINNLIQKGFIMEIKIKYHSDIEPIKAIDVGDWIDLRAAEDVYIPKGEFKLISLGVSMQLPEGYEAHVAPRSSTYKNFKIIQTNGVGM